MSFRPRQRIPAVRPPPGPRLCADYRFFFPFAFLEPDGITLATVLAIELAIFATTPFLELRFFAPVVFFDLVFVALLVFDFGLVAAAFFAITDSGTASPLQVTLILVSVGPFRRPPLRQNSLNILARLLSNPPIMKRVIHVATHLPTMVCAWCKHVMRPGAPKVSHGICRSCTVRWFGKLRPPQLPA